MAEELCVASLIVGECDTAMWGCKHLFQGVLIDFPLEYVTLRHHVLIA